MSKTTENETPATGSVPRSDVQPDRAHVTPSPDISGEAEAARIEAQRLAAQSLEAGRLLFARPWEFVTSVGHYGQLSVPQGVEVAFAGRSNVGKSSLINALTGRSALARTSNTPGRTQLLNFFRADPRVSIVDMPGYGYAEAPKKTVDAWTDLIFDYLRGRTNLRRVFVLVDSRHGLKGNDLAALKALDMAAVTYQIVLTKVDKVKAPALTKVHEATATALLRRPAAFPGIIATSSEKGDGLPQLRAVIAEIAGFPAV